MTRDLMATSSSVARLDIASRAKDTPTDAEFVVIRARCARGPEMDMSSLNNPAASEVKRDETKIVQKNCECGHDILRAIAMTDP